MVTIVDPKDGSCWSLLRLNLYVFYVSILHITSMCDNNMLLDKIKIEAKIAYNSSLYFLKFF